jgi:hypothetical protein
MDDNNVIPIQRVKDRLRDTGREFVPTGTPVDIHTSELPMRVIECDDGEVRLYPAVQHDCPIDDKQVKDRTGRAFGRMFSSEPIGMSPELTAHVLSMVYGPTVAESMLYRAEAGGYIYGQQITHTGNGYRWKGGINVAADQSRPDDGYVVQFNGLRQRSGR